MLVTGKIVVMSDSEIQVMESELYEFLPPLNEGELETIFEKMQVTCPEAAKGKKNILLRLIFKQMTVLLAEEDQGFATLKIIHDYVTSIQGVKVEVVTDKPDVEAEELRKFEALLDKKILGMKTETASGLMDKKILDLKAQAAASTTASELKVSKFTPLKINGTIGTKAGCMSYTDLNFQISNAQKQGYNDEQISGAVIKAMSTNNNLRTYFESVPDVKLEEMMEILRPYFEQKNSAALFADLCNAAQANEQNCMDFVVGLLGLKLRILDLSTEEGVPMDNKRLVGQFQKSLFTGIRNTNIRTDIREFCRGNPKATDQQLIKVVAEAMAIERDRAQKMAGGTDVCYVGVDQDKTDSQTVKPVTNNNKKKENLLPAQILELQASQERLVATVSEIQSSMAATNNLLAARFQDDYKHNNFSIPNYFPNFPQNLPPNFPGNTNFSTGPMGSQQPSQNLNNNKNSKNQNNKKSNKCNSCLVNKAFNCNHCFRCGSEGHKMEACPNQYKNNNNGPTNQGGGQPGGQVGGQQGQAVPPPWNGQNMQGPWMGPNQNGPWNMQPGQGGGQQGQAGPQMPWNLNAPVWNGQNTQGGAQQQGPAGPQGPWGKKN